MGTPFTPRIQWAEPYQEQWTFLTDIYQGEDDQEQRRLLKIIPDRQDSFTVLTTDPRRSGLLESLLYAGQLESFTVPFWPDAAKVTGTVSPGAGVVVTCPTTDRDFMADGLALLYQDEFTCEQVVITSVGSGTVTLTSVTGTYTNPLLIPGRVARVADSQHTRLGVGLDQSTLTFDYEKGLDPGITRLTLGVFNVAAFNRNTDPQFKLTNSRLRMVSATNTFIDYTRGGSPIGSRGTLPLVLDSRAKVKALRNWFIGLRGRYTAFWLPTYQMDLMPVDDVISNVSSLTIRSIQYTTRLFPFERHRHLAFITHAGVVTHRRVTASVDNLDGTETLTLSGGSGGDINVLRGSGLVSYMLYCRLANDNLAIRWDTSATSAQTTLEVVELPRETPTTT